MFARPDSIVFDTPVANGFRDTRLVTHRFDRRQPNA
jgi:hypothetical protein